MKFLAFLIYCCISSIDKSLTATWNCRYGKEGFHFQSNYRKVAIAGYTCDLTSNKTNPTTVTKINGQHQSGMSDDDVIILFVHNNLKTFSSNLCQKFKNLRAIEVYEHNVELFIDNSLENCKNLEFIYMSGNKLRDLPGELFIGNTKLTHIRMHKNNLTTLPENIFQNQNQLEEIYLRDNEINFLPFKVFDPLVNLKYLELEDNQLQVINPAWFVNLGNLELLGLSGNKITQLATGTFKSLGNLRSLYMKSNKIAALSPDSFVGLKNLNKLVLADNEIVDLPSNIFVPLTNLKELYIHKNKLDTIHSDSFGTHNQLTTIYAKDNRLNSLDGNIMNKTAVNYFNMENNYCNNEDIETREDIFKKLGFFCFENYRSRAVLEQHTTTVKPSQFQEFIKPSTHHEAISCGKSMIAKGNIIGGAHIVRGSYPWIAALVTVNDDYFCGGTLVSDTKIVTAAHCIQPKGASAALQTKYFKVYLGGHDLNVQNEVGRIPYAVQEAFIHPDWNQDTERFDADIAVLLLEEPVSFNRRIQPICMIEQSSSIREINSGLVVGYGKSEDKTIRHEKIPKVLELPIHSNEDCFLLSYNLARFSSKRTFCGGNGNGTGVCDGDSGGGLVVSRGDVFYLRGIVSSSLFTSQKECDVDNYSIFTDMMDYNDWVVGIGPDNDRR